VIGKKGDEKFLMPTVFICVCEVQQLSSDDGWYGRLGGKGVQPTLLSLYPFFMLKL
jgi:hypothetical protein